MGEVHFLGYGTVAIRQSAALGDRFEEGRCLIYFWALVDRKRAQRIGVGPRVVRSPQTICDIIALTAGSAPKPRPDRPEAKKDPGPDRRVASAKAGRPGTAILAVSRPIWREDCFAATSPLSQI